MRPKYEREIDEILSQFDDGTPTRVVTPIPILEQPIRLKPRPRFAWRPMVSVSASSLMIAALAMAVLGYPLQWVFPPAVGPVGIIAAVLLIASLVMSVTRSGRARANTRPMWRGQPLETPKDPFGADDMRRRWRRWRAHQRFRQPPWN